MNMSFVASTPCVCATTNTGSRKGTSLLCLYMYVSHALVLVQFSLLMSRHTTSLLIGTTHYAVTVEHIPITSASHASPQHTLTLYASLRDVLLAMGFNRERKPKLESE